jgi:hypothetical protein
MIRLIFACGICFILASCRPPPAWVSPREQESNDEMRSAPRADLEIGDQIIAALEKYNTDQGHYPQELSELLPRYLPAITPPKFGEKKWTYSPREHSFALFLYGETPSSDGYVYGAPETSGK